MLVFLISSEPGIRGIYSLTKLFNRVDFPARVTENLNYLIENKLIIVLENFENGTAKEYEITENGKLILIKEFIDSEIIKFVTEMDKPKLILEITENYIKKKNGS